MMAMNGRVTPAKISPNQKVHLQFASVDKNPDIRGPKMGPKVVACKGQWFLTFAAYMMFRCLSLQP